MSAPKKSRAPITTHVLDVARGRPASGIAAVLEVQASGSWMELGKRSTDADGRIEDFLPPDHRLAAGTYRVTFETGSYQQATQGAVFYPSVAISFVVKDPSQHFHVPLLLSPYGYSTYRGS